MAEILVSNVCASRPPLPSAGFFIASGHHDDIEPSHPTWRRLARSAVALSSGVQPDISTRPDFPSVPLARRIVFSLFFPLFSIVLASPDFLKVLQWLAL
jgi:hypothetical protein